MTDLSRDGGIATDLREVTELLNSNGNAKGHVTPTPTSAGDPVISRRRFVRLFGAAASLALIGSQRPAMASHRPGDELGATPFDPIHTPSGTIYFRDGFNRAENTFTRWDRAHVDNGSATTDPEVKRRGTHALRLSVQDIDSNTFGWSGVRSHLVKYDLFHEGLERHISWSTYVPESHPNPTTWFNMMQFGYTGYSMPPTLFELRGDGHFGLIYHATSQAIPKWRSNANLKGAWHDFAMRILFHRNPKIGFVEFWVDGVAQTMANGDKRIYYSTLNPLESAGSLSHLHVCNYRGRYQMPWSTIYHDAVVVGDSYAVVDPTD